MFTGIIETTAKVLSKASGGLTIERPASFDDVKIGSSICVAGACLSIVELTPSSMRFDVVDETWAKTRLGELKKGERVNLERAMKASDRLDGHVVQGHVEGVGTVTSYELRVSRMTISIPNEFKKFVVLKGSFAIDGVSLTVADVHDDEVTIALIPHTLANTTLGALKKGDLVNVETDVLLKAARKK